MRSVVRLAAFLILGSGARLEGAAAASAWAIEHANVVDVVRGIVSSNQTIVLRGTRIATVGDASRVLVPTDASRMEAAGRYLMPGLWDMHVHTLWGEWTNHARLFVANGVTGVRDLNTDLPKSSLGRWRQDIADGVQAGPRFVVAGPILDGPEPVWPSSIRITSAADARAAVRQWNEEGRDQFKVYEFLPRDAFFAVLDEAGKFGKAVTGHVPQAVSATEAAAAGLKCIEHFSHVLAECSVPAAERDSAVADADPALTQRLTSELQATIDGRPDLQFWFDGAKGWFDSPQGKAWRELKRRRGQVNSLELRSVVPFSSGRRLTYRVIRADGSHDFVTFELDSADRLALGADLLLFDEANAAVAFAIFQKHHTWFCPTFAAKEPAQMSGATITNDHRLRYVSKAVRSRSGWQWYPAPEEYIRQEKEVERMISAAHRSGLLFLCGTDALYPWVFPGFSVHDELELLVRRGGLSATEALRTATIHPARFLGREGDLGTVEPGRLADLVLVDSNPLEDIRNTRRINSVIANGRVFRRSELDTLLREVELAVRSEL